MTKFFLSPEAIDSVIDSRSDANSDEIARDEIGSAMFRVIAEDVMDANVDRSEIAAAVMVEEYNNLPEEKQSAADRGGSVVIDERLKEKYRGLAKAMLRWLISLGST